MMPKIPSFDPKYCALFILPLWAFLSLLAGTVLGWPFITQTLPGPDDYMRLVRVTDLLQGLDYGPAIQPRLGPEGGAAIPWSRLVDLPLYGVASFFALFTSQANAALLVASFVPLLLLLATSFAACWAVTPLLNTRQAAMAGPLLFLLGPVMYQYMPGRIDHHGWQVLILLLSFGAMIRLYFKPTQKRYAGTAGIFCAAGLAIGAEIVPWVALLSTIPVLLWISKGTVFQRAGLVFGAAFFSGTLFFTLLTLPPNIFLTPACDGLSMTYVTLALAALVFWLLIAIIPAQGTDTPPKRIIFATAIGTALLGIIYILYPSCFHDPYGITDPTLRTIWLEKVNEAQPAWRYAAQKPGLFLLYFIPVLMGFIVSLYAYKKTDIQRTFWLIFSIIIGAGLVLSLLQIRIFVLSQAVTLIPLSWGASILLTRALQFSKRTRLIAEALFFLLCIGLFFAVTQAPEKNGQAAKQTVKPCSVRQTADILNDLEPQPLTIAAGINEGSEFIYRTHHRFLAAPYHRNGEGILAAYGIFAQPEEQARKLVQKYNVDVLIVCTGEELNWRKQNSRAFAVDLITKNVPDWLTPVAPGKSGGYLIFRVIK